LRRPEVRDCEIEPRLHLAIGGDLMGDGVNIAARLEGIARPGAICLSEDVGLLDHVAEVNADAEFDAPLRRHAGVALDEAILHLDRAAHRVDHAAELDKNAVAGAFDDAPAMGGDGGIDQIAAQAPKPRKRAVLVGAGEAAVADHVGDQDRRDLPGFGHGALTRHAE
jgi:hypothetical protein